MPTYQYACTACGHQLEAVQSFTDSALTECPACAGQLRKVFSAVGIVFKGSGFYRTDSRSGANASADAAATPPTGTNGHKDGKTSSADSSSDSSAASSSGSSSDSSKGNSTAASSSSSSSSGSSSSASSSSGGGSKATSAA